MSNSSIEVVDTCTPYSWQNRFQPPATCNSLFTTNTFCQGASSSCQPSNTAYRFCNIPSSGADLQQSIGPEEQRCKPGRRTPKGCNGFQFAGTECPTGWKLMSSGLYQARSMSTYWCCPTDNVLTELSVANTNTGYCYGTSTITTTTTVSSIPATTITSMLAPRTVLPAIAPSDFFHYTAAAILLYEHGDTNPDRWGPDRPEPPPSPQQTILISSNTGLSNGAVAGVSVAGFIVALFVLLIAGFLYWRQRKQREQNETFAMFAKPELDSSPVLGKKVIEIRGPGMSHSTLFELEDTSKRIELSSEYYGGHDAHTTSPIELESPSQYRRCTSLD